MVFKIGKKWNHSKCPSADDMVCIINYRLGELNGRHFFSEIVVLVHLCLVRLFSWFAACGSLKDGKKKLHVSSPFMF